MQQPDAVQHPLNQHQPLMSLSVCSWTYSYKSPDAKPNSEERDNSEYIIPGFYSRSDSAQTRGYDIFYLYRPRRMDFLFVGVSESCRFVGLLKTVACLTKNARAWNVPIRRNMLGFVQPSHSKGYEVGRRNGEFYWISDIILIDHMISVVEGLEIIHPAYIRYGSWILCSCKRTSIMAGVMCRI